MSLSPSEHRVLIDFAAGHAERTTGVINRTYSMRSTFDDFKFSIRDLEDRGLVGPAPEFRITDEGLAAVAAAEGTP